MYIKVKLLGFPVRAYDRISNKMIEEIMILSDMQVQGAHLAQETEDELLTRLYDRRGCTVLSISRPTQRTATLDLDELWLCNVPNPFSYTPPPVDDYNDVDDENLSAADIGAREY